MRHSGVTVYGMVLPSDIPSHGSTHTSDSTNGFKIWAIVCIIFISVFGGFAPLWLHCISEELRCRVTNFSKFFASGVFLGVGLLHMLPEAAQGLEELGWGEGTGKLPVAFAVSAMGFVLVWFIERVSHSRSSSFGGKGRIMAAAAQAEKMGGGSLCYVQVETVSSYGPLICKPVGIIPISGAPGASIPGLPPVQWAIPGDLNRDKLTPALTYVVLPAASGQTQNIPPPAPLKEPLLSTLSTLSTLVSQEYYRHACNPGGQPAPSHSQRGMNCRGDVDPPDSCQDPKVPPQRGPTSASPNLQSPRHHHHLSPLCHLEGDHSTPPLCADVAFPAPPQSTESDGMHDSNLPFPPQQGHPADNDHSHSWGSWSGVEGGSSGDVCGALHEHKHDARHHHLMLPGGGGVSYLLAGLFSLHSFVVGAALGTESSLNGAASLLIAIAAHKGAEAFAVGVEFVREKVPVDKTVGILLVYCTMTPLGIVTGMLAQLVQGPTGALITNFTQAFGSGTVLYIVMHLLGTDDGTDNQVGVLELFLLLCGLSIMAAVSMYS